MSNWRPTFDPEHLYFITTKAVNYAHAFQRDIVKRILLDTLDCMRSQKRIKIYSFVIMPNHLHAVTQFSAQSPLDDFVRDYKRQTADHLLRQLKAEENAKALDFFATQVQRTDKQQFKVWENGYNAKEIVSADFLRQKMEYIHNNPCQPHWNLSTTPEAYIWSSARFYLTEHPCIVPLDDARELLL
ncbi:MAG: transposase [Chloroflexi bacterium]|nr:transposase [Chloroflexota bacterium]